MKSLDKHDWIYVVFGEKQLNCMWHSTSSRSCGWRALETWRALYLCKVRWGGVVCAAPAVAWGAALQCTEHERFGWGQIARQASHIKNSAGQFISVKL